jgi:hypothetical protein
MNLRRYIKAVAYFETQHAMVVSLKLARMQSDTTMDMCVDFTFDVRAGRQGTATEADQAPGIVNRPQWRT